MSEGYQIKSVNGELLYKAEAESFKQCLELAVKGGVNLYRADLYKADLSGVCLHVTDLRGANLCGANLCGANLRGSYLNDANLYGANLSGANLSGAKLSVVNLRLAKLYGANLRRANLYDANLSGAELQGADLREAYLGGAQLGKANLREADLREAYLGWATLYDANLRGTKGIVAEAVTPLYALYDQPGHIRMYKLVDDKYFGPGHGGIGGIRYEIGKTYKVNDANTDIHEQWSVGLNVATLDWCLKKYKPGYHILLVQFRAKDIACIPIATDGKFRLHRLKVVEELSQERIDIALGGEQ